MINKTMKTLMICLFTIAIALQPAMAGPKKTGQSVGKTYQTTSKAVSGKSKSKSGIAANKAKSTKFKQMAAKNTESKASKRGKAPFERRTEK